MTSTELKEIREQGHDVTPPESGGVVFEWWIVNMNGAGFKLIQEPHHSDEDIENAKKYLRRERDVVGAIRVENVSAESPA
jgi:hypothetical protein